MDIIRPYCYTHLEAYRAFIMYHITNPWNQTAANCNIIYDFCFLYLFYFLSGESCVNFNMSGRLWRTSFQVSIYFFICLVLYLVSKMAMRWTVLTNKNRPFFSCFLFQATEDSYMAFALSSSVQFSWLLLTNSCLYWAVSISQQVFSLSVCTALFQLRFRNESLVPIRMALDKFSVDVKVICTVPSVEVIPTEYTLVTTRGHYFAMFT